jgi:hypothetical protein
MRGKEMGFPGDHKIDELVLTCIKLSGL